MSSEMVANLEWVSTAPDSENNYTMECPFRLEGEPSNMGTATEPVPDLIPKAVLICRHNSHPFQKRTLILHQPVKVGRSVAKTKADMNNAIFDCKVLSRHHASLWYENGHFYLADTKSSNGTFVNSHRLSEGSKESAPYEVCSGDIVQFGVDVMENSGSVSVTHGCIVATLKLYLPDGKEAKASPNMAMQSMPLDDLHILNKIIQEAVDREYMLEEKLSSLRQAVDSCRNAADMSWRAQVCEDHLLCRVHFLEKRLAATNTNTPPTELQQLLEDKHKYEVSAKESLRLALEERLKLRNQVCNLQWSLCSTEDECAVLRSSTERAHEQYQILSSKYSTLESQMKTAQKALENAENRVTEEKMRLEDIVDEHDRQVNQLKSENEKHTVLECGIDELMDSENSDLIIDNKTWDKADFKESTLLEAVRGLPDYIKAILPDQILNKVGCKSLRTSSHVAELKSKLLVLKKELRELEIDITDEVNDNTAHNTSNNKENSIDDISIDSNSTPINNVACNDVQIEDLQSKEPSDVVCDTLEKAFAEMKDIINHKEASQNSNFSEKPDQDSANDKRTILMDEIKTITDQLDQVTEEGPIEKMIFLQDNMSNLQSKLVSSRNERKILQSSLAQSKNKIIELQQDKEQLLSEKKALEGEISEKSDICRSLELQIAHWKEKEKSDEISSAKYKEIASELQNQLSKAFESEANSCRELKELNMKIFELQTQLDSRPLATEVVLLQCQVKKYQDDLAKEEKYAEELQNQVSVLADMQVSLEDKLNKTLSELNTVSNECCKCKKLDVNGDNGQIDSQILSDGKATNHIVISSSLSAENLMWNHDQNRTVLSVDLNKMAELEEQLVVTKEKWAHVTEENSQLTSELHNMTEKYNRLASRSNLNILIYVVPLAAIILYVLVMHQSIS
ncbi:sarcolemma associated protein isoform X2 [Arctopsyche grandis]|uniref:sarcolemma associated protein isoform X2 n=1 Tax=Arctopsyche grandis TaxID=121162 RepID=UPI00406D7474